SWHSIYGERVMDYDSSLRQAWFFVLHSKYPKAFFRTFTNCKSLLKAQGRNWFLEMPCAIAMYVRLAD
ncbi:MAG: hypothetical protein ACXWD4_14605, partial [Bacteroidia bacterium]